jgi:uncharacterized damage-inducible protein DinB
MPGLAPPVSDEREGLLAFLSQQRDAFRNAAFGLTDEEANAARSASALTIAGLVKHVTAVERSWMDTMLQRRNPSTDEYESNFVLGLGETLASVLDDYAAAAAETEAIVAGIDDLGRAVPVPPGVPWFPDDVEAWSVRWVLLHLIEETARHAGHADIVRESIDGATCYSLMAAVEGWPASEWMQPWEPSAAHA